MATEIFENNYASKCSQLKGLELFDYCEAQVRILRNLIEEESVTPYSDFQFDEEQLYSIFHTRTLLYRADDRNHLSSVVLKRRLAELFKEFQNDYVSSLSEYSFEKFLNEPPNPYFLKYGAPLKINQLESDKIYNWQREHWSIAISLELEALIKFQTQGKVSPINPSQDLKSLSQILTTDISLVDAFEKFKSFTILTNVDLTAISQESFDTIITSLRQEIVSYQMIYPSLFYNIVKHYSKGSTGFQAHSSGLIVFSAIKALTGSAISKTFDFTQWIPKDTINQAQEKAKLKLSEISFNQLGIAQIFDHFESMFNVIYKNQYVFTYTNMLSDIAELEKSILHDVNVSIKPLDQINSLEAAFVFHERIKKLDEALSNLVDYSRMPNDSENTLFNEIPDLLVKMSSNFDWYKRLIEIQDEAIFLEKVKILPIYFKHIRTEALLTDLLQSALKDLENQLEQSDNQSALHYLNKSIHDLRLKPIKEFTYQHGELTNRFLEFLKIKSEYLNLRSTSINLPFSNKKKSPITQETFGFRDKQKPLLLEVFHYLNREINLLNADLSTPETFAKILISKTPMDENAIYFDCKTNEIAVLFDELKRISKKCTFAKVYKSGMFFSKKGNVIKPFNLSQSKANPPLTEKMIRAAFAPFHK